MGSEEVKIRTLLDYWIEHNKEHGQEFKEWAEKMKEVDKPIVSSELLQASMDMDNATEHLYKARERL
jgi:hypothetical protein